MVWIVGGVEVAAACPDCLRHDLRRMIPREAARSLAAMIAAMIDGVWLRAALSEWQEADSESAQALLTAFVDGRLRELARVSVTDGAQAASDRVAHRPSGEEHSIRVINPATGVELAELAVDGPSQVNAAVERARVAQKDWQAMTGAERGRVLQRAARLLRPIKLHTASLRLPRS